MSSYATLEDFKLYGLSGPAWENLVSSDVQHVLDAASSLADSYLNSRFSVPIASPPESLKEAVCRIAAYNLPSVVGYNPEGQTENIRLRYEDAIRWLEGVSKNLITPPGMSEPAGSVTGSGGVPFVVAPSYSDCGEWVSGEAKSRGWR